MYYLQYTFAYSGYALGKKSLEEKDSFDRIFDICVSTCRVFLRLQQLYVR